MNKNRKGLFSGLALGAVLLGLIGAGVTSTTWQVGRGTGENISLIFNKGSGSTNPKIQWDNSAGKIKFSHDGTLSYELGAGSIGEVSVIESPNDIGTKWVASGAGVTVATTTTASDLPLSGVSANAIKITPVSSTDYVRYRWTMPEALKYRKLKAEWWQRPLSGYASGDLKFDIYKHSDTGTCTYSGGSYTRVDLSTDSSSVSGIPNLTGKYTTTFDTDSGDCYELRFVRTAGTTALNIGQVIVGPGVQPQGSVVSPPVQFTCTGSWSSNTTYATNCQYVRIGNQAILQFKLAVTGAPTNASLTFNMPTGLTIDTNALVFPSGGNTALTLPSSGTLHDSDTRPYFAFARYATTSTITVLYAEGTTVHDPATLNATTPFTWASGDSIALTVQVPIAEWAGSGTVNLAQNNVEYAYNTSTSTSANDTTSFAYGPRGALVQNITATLTRRVRFLTPLQPGEVPYVSLSVDGIKWLPLTYATAAGYLIAPLNYTAGVELSGIGVKAVAGSNTDVDVVFGTYGASAGATTYSWSTTGGGALYWRIQKSAAGIPVGFGAATSTMSGLVSRQATGTFTIAEDTKVNLTGTGAFPTGQWSRVGNIVFGAVTGYSTTNITGYSVTSSGARTYLNMQLTGLPGNGATDWLSVVGGGAVADNSADKAIATKVSQNGSFKLLVEWIPGTTGTHTIRNIFFMYMISE